MNPDWPSIEQFAEFRRFYTRPLCVAGHLIYWRPAFVASEDRGAANMRGTVRNQMCTSRAEGGPRTPTLPSAHFPGMWDRRQKTEKDSFDIRPRTDTVRLRQVR